MKFFPWDFQNFSLGNGKSKIPFSLGIPMMGIPRAETLILSAQKFSQFNELKMRYFGRFSNNV